MPASGSSSTAFPGGWLTRERVNLYCAILLAVEIAVFLFMAAGTHGLIVPLAKPTSTDFVSFYAAGSLANAGTPELAYDRAEHYSAEERAKGARTITTTSPLGSALVGARKGDEVAYQAPGGTFRYQVVEFHPYTA